MEAVCYFCLCAINQHRLKKTKAIKPIELLNQTWKLLKYYYILKDVLNFDHSNLAKCGHYGSHQKIFQLKNNLINEIILILLKNNHICQIGLLF